MSIYICIYVYIYKYTHICIYIYIYIYTCTYISKNQQSGGWGAYPRPVPVASEICADTNSTRTTPVSDTKGGGSAPPLNVWYV